MTSPAPLATPQYNRLRTPGYAANRLLSLFSNRVALAGTVQTDLTAAISWSQFNFTGTSGSYTDCLTNMALLIGTVNDIKQATFRGRLRTAPSSSIIYSNESSQNFGTGSFFWVIDTRDIQYVLSRPSSLDPETAEELVNYNQTYQGLLPIVIGLQTAYVGYVNGSGYLRIGVDLSQSFAAESGATIASYLSVIPGAIVVAGALNQSIFIVDIPYGERWGQSTVTDSGGRALTRDFAVKVHDPVLYPPDTGFEGGTIASTLDAGATLSIPAFAGVDDLLYNTFGIAWRAKEQYGGVSGGLYDANSAAITNKALTANVATLTAAGHPFETGQTLIIADVDATFNGTHVITATTVNTYSYVKVHADVVSAGCSGMAVCNPVNIDFVGWLSREDDTLQGDAKRSVISGAKFVFTGVGPRLARLTAQLVAMQEANPATRWGEMINATPWRAIWHFWSRYTTVATLCDVSFDDTTNTFLFPEMSSQGGNALKACQDIASQIDAVIEFLPWGGIEVNRDINWLTQSERDAKTPFADWTTSDAYGTPRSIDPNPNIGRADTDSATYNPTTQQVTFFAARAPGIAQGEAQGTATLPSQILAAATNPADGLAESEQRIGNKFNVDNLREFLDVDHRSGCVGVPIYPSRSRIATWTLVNVAGPNGLNRVNYDDSVLWTVESVTQTYDQKKGKFTDQVRYRRVAEVGDPGDDITQKIPPPGGLPQFPYLGFPAFNFQIPLAPEAGSLITHINPAKLIPPAGRVAFADGNTVLAWSDTVLELVSNFINLTYPQTRNITPSALGAYLIQSALFDPFNTGLASSSVSPRNNYLYALANNGTNSFVKSTPNGFAPVPFYLQSNLITGVYTLLRATGTPGSLMAYTPNLTNLTSAVFSDVGYGGTPFPQTAAAGDTITISSTLVSNGVFCENRIGFSVAPGVRVTVLSTTGWTPFNNGAFYPGAACGAGGGVAAGVFRWNYTPVGGTTVSFSNTAGGAGPIELNTLLPGGFINELAATSSTAWSIVLHVDAVSGSASVVVATDYAITFGSAITVGSAPISGAGGFDVQKSGGVSYAAADGAIYKASTIGGAYSSWFSIPGGANAVCLIIPYYRRNSSTLNTSVSNPDVIAACTNGKLYWIDGTAATATDISPSGFTEFNNANCVTVLRGNKVACFGLNGATAKLALSQDGGATYSISTITTPQFIRDRRGDNSTGTNKGQLFLAGNGTANGYSSKWGSAGLFPRYLPITAKGVDPLG